MIVDSSAVIAVILDEPAASNLLAAMSEADRLAIGAPTLVETGIVLVARLGPLGRTLLGRFCEEFSIATEAFSQDHWSMAVDAYQQFGKGRHPAALNFGDCMTYATALLANETLLCVGNDFPLTDLEVVAVPN